MNYIMYYANMFYLIIPCTLYSMNTLQENSTVAHHFIYNQNNQKMDQLHTAINHNNITLVKTLLSDPTINLALQNHQGNTALHLAIEKKYYTIVMELIGTCFKQNKLENILNIRNQDYYKPLHFDKDNTIITTLRHELSHIHPHEPKNHTETMYSILSMLSSSINDPRKRRRDS